MNFYINSRYINYLHSETIFISRYIHRFRYSEPKSREQRAKEKVTSQQKTEFWWMSSSSPPTHSSTPTTPPPWKNGTVSSSLSQRSPLRMNGPGRVLSQRSNVGRGGSGLSSTTSQMVRVYSKSVLYDII